MTTVSPHAIVQQELSFADSLPPEKQCSKCHRRKPLTDFQKRNDRKSGVTSACRQCLKSHIPPKHCSQCHQIKPISDFPRTSRNLDRDTCWQCLPAIQQKRCSKCHETKLLSDFPVRNNRKNGVQSRCKQCQATFGRKYLTKDPDYHRKQALSRYGLTLDQYTTMLTSQGGVCKVCSGPSLGKGRYHVDHDHVTGKVRGLLCHKCNVALGMVQDNVEHLQALIAYLQESEVS